MSKYAGMSYSTLYDIIYETIQTTNGSGHHCISWAVPDDDLLMALIDAADTWDDAYVRECFAALCNRYDVDAESFDDAADLADALRQAIEKKGEN